MRLAEMVSLFVEVYLRRFFFLLGGFKNDDKNCQLSIVLLPLHRFSIYHIYII